MHAFASQPIPTGPCTASVPSVSGSNHFATAMPINSPWYREHAISRRVLNMPANECPMSHLTPFLDFTIARALDCFVCAFEFISVNWLWLSLHERAVPCAEDVFDVGQVRLHRMHHLVHGSHLMVGLRGLLSRNEAKLAYGIPSGVFSNCMYVRGLLKFRAGREHHSLRRTFIFPWLPHRLKSTYTPSCRHKKTVISPKQYQQQI